MCDEESRAEFVTYSRKFGGELGEAIKLMNPGKEEFRLDPEEVERVNRLGETDRLAWYESRF